MDFPLIDLMDEDACYRKLVELLHPDGLACPRCGAAERLGVHRRHRDPVLDYQCGALRPRLQRLDRDRPAGDAPPALADPADPPRRRPGRAHGADGPRAGLRPQAPAGAAAPPPGARPARGWTATRWATPWSRPTRCTRTRGKKGIPHPDPDDPPRRRANRRRGHGTFALWGDSFAPANPEGRALAVPLDADPFPHQAEPLGGLLALFTALFEDGVRAVYVRGGLTGFESLLRRPVLLRPARRPDSRGPDGGRPVRRGGCAGTSAVANGGPGRRARPRGRARRDGQGHGAGPVGIPRAGRRDQPPARRGRCGKPSGRTLAPGAVARGTRPEDGTSDRVRRPPAYACRAARVRLTRSLSRSAEPGRRSRLEAR